VPDRESALFKALLASLYPGRVILIGVEDGTIAERVLLDDTEVVPALSLGDVVAEELNVSVPYGTVIAFVSVAVFSSDASAAIRGDVIGRVYAQILVEALHRGGFPMDRETGLLLGLAESAVAAVSQIEAGTGLICRGAFEQALAATLRSVLFGGVPAVDPPVRLKDLKARYGAAHQADVSRAAEAGVPSSFEEWLLAVASSEARLGDSVGATDGGRKTAVLKNLTGH